MSRADNTLSAQPSAVSENKNERSTWSTPGTITAGKTLYVKRFKSEYEDNIHLLRINQRSEGTKFQFPSFFIPDVIARLNAILNKVEDNGEGKCSLVGCENVTNWYEFTSDSFWAGGDSIKVSQFRMKPYISSFGTLNFRLWNEIDEEYYKTFENSHGTFTWRGPMASISLHACRKLVSALEKLKNAAPDN